MKVCACGKANCVVRLQEDTARRNVQRLERELDDAYEARRVAAAQWIAHLEEMAA